MGKIRVALAEDNVLLREGVSRLVSANEEFELVGTASDLPQLLALVREQLPDVVITDIRMPDVDGLDFRRVLKHRFPALPVVLMTGLPLSEEDMVPRNVEVLQKPFTTDALLRAVLVKLFDDRQLAVDETVIGYVSLRIERSFAAAQAVVARLDDEAMRHKRPLTRAFAAEILRATEA